MQEKRKPETAKIPFVGAFQFGPVLQLSLKRLYQHRFLATLPFLVLGQCRWLRAKGLNGKSDHIITMYWPVPKWLRWSTPNASSTQPKPHKPGISHENTSGRTLKPRDVRMEQRPQPSPMIQWAGNKTSKSTTSMQNNLSLASRSPSFSGLLSINRNRLNHTQNNFTIAQITTRKVIATTSVDITRGGESQNRHLVSKGMVTGSEVMPQAVVDQYPYGPIETQTPLLKDAPHSLTDRDESFTSSGSFTHTRSTIYASAPLQMLTIMTGIVERLVKREVQAGIKKQREEQQWNNTKQVEMSNNLLAANIATDEVARMLLKKIQTLAQEDRFRLGQLR